MYKTQDFDFELPEHLIAQHPTAQRTASRLLHLGGGAGALHDRLFVDLLHLVAPNDVLIFNDTRVMKARLFGKKSTGGAVEVLVERILSNNRVLAHVRASKSPPVGTRLWLEEAVEVEVLARHDTLFELAFLTHDAVADILAQYGHLPLPPYITHLAGEEDEARYQTVYAKHQGAVAAPNAGLHFDEAMLAALKHKGVQLGFVTLHVGAGTFQPVKVENISDHKMHSEVYHVSAETVALINAAKQAGGRVLAVGTTALRALESAAQPGRLQAGHGDTHIFITPGYTFKVVDSLLTNFHLPKSTLLMLVSAFAGFAQIKQAYQHAVEQQYRFFSYGDAMLLERRM